MTLSVVYTYDEVGVNKGFDYGRHCNPTRGAFERCLAALENGSHCLTFASGMASADAALRLLRPGDHLLLTEDIYGGTWRLVEDILKPAGLEATFAPLSTAAQARSAIRPNTKMVWMESPTNPLLRLADIREVAAVAAQNGALTVVDNTFATPFGQNPLDLGADIVMHSTTKYIGGHSDVLGGALVTNNHEIAQRLAAISRISGAVPSPFDSYLNLRGVKTLSLRMTRHAENAIRIARFLEDHPKVIAVYYPGLESHPNHALACTQMRSFGGMLAFELKGGEEAALAMLNGVRLFTLTGSLGGVESIISYPKEMSHVALSSADRLRLGVTDGVVRLSVGIEDPEDLIEDLSQALARVM